jgi:hypothetical protein
VQRLAKKTKGLVAWQFGLCALVLVKGTMAEDAETASAEMEVLLGMGFSKVCLKKESSFPVFRPHGIM